MDSPTVLRRRLGSELRRLRERSGLQAKDAANALGFSPAKVSRIESGSITLKEVDVRALLKLYGVADESDLRQFVSLARQSTQRGWWHDYGNTLPEWFQTYVGLEGDASLIRTYEPELVPGLLQTRDYARAILEVSPPAHPENDPERRLKEIERRLDLRMQRQEVFQRTDPPVIQAVLSEAVLRRPVGGAEVMRAQVRNLVTVSRRPDITIQVLPSGAGAHPSMSMPFSILSFSDVPGDIVYIEALTSSLYIEKESDIRRHELVFERLINSAMTPEESVSWMEELAVEGYGNGG